jgi:hypothetical protein
MVVFIFVCRHWRRVLSSTNAHGNMYAMNFKYVSELLQFRRFIRGF